MSFLNAVVEQIVEVIHFLRCKYYYRFEGYCYGMKLEIGWFINRNKRKIENHLWIFYYAVEAFFSNREQVVNKVMIHVDIDSEVHLEVYDVASMSIRRALYAVSTDLLESARRDINNSYGNPFFVELLQDDRVVAASTVKRVNESSRAPSVDLNWGFAN